MGRFARWWPPAALAAGAVWEWRRFSPGEWNALAAQAHNLLPLGPHIAANWGIGALSGAIALLFLALCDAAGVRVLRLLSGRRPRGAVRLVALLLGYAILSTALLGTAALGLWQGVALWGALAVFAAYAAPELPAAAGEWVRGAKDAWDSSPAWGRALWIVSAVFWLPLLLSPETNADCQQYHLGFPAQMLLTHRLIGRDIYMHWAFPLVVELPNAYPIMLGLDAAARAMRPAMALVGGLALLRGAGFWPSAAAAAGSAWLGICAPVFAYVLGYAKNDAFAAGAFLGLAGVLAECGALARGPCRSPSLLVAGLLGGLLLSVKYVLVVPAAVFLLAALFFRRFKERPRTLGILAAGVLLPPLPWLLKSWFYLGDPVYPLGAVFLPACFADPGLGGAEQVLLANFVQETRPRADLPHAVLTLAGRNFAVVAAALPCLMLFRTPGLGAMLASSVLALAGLALGIRSDLGFVERFALPVFAMWGTLGFAALARGFAQDRLAAEALRLPAMGTWCAKRERFARSRATGVAAAMRLSRAAARMTAWAAALALAAAFHFRVMAAQGFFFPDAPVTGWMAGRVSTEGFRLRAQEAWGAVLPAVKREVGARPGRVLEVGESRTFGVPARAIPEGFEAPFVWRAAAGADSPERIYIRFRQGGIRWLIHNHMIASWYRFQPSPFPWTPAMLRRYAEFARTRLRLAASSGRCDPGVGCDWLFEVLPRSRHPSPRRILFLPGTEPAFTFASLARLNGAVEEARRRFAQLRSQLPEVVWLDVLLSETLLAGGRYPEARELSGGAVRAGLADDMSLLTYAVAAGRTGRPREAEMALEQAARVCPHMPEKIAEARRAAGR